MTYYLGRRPSRSAAWSRRIAAFSAVLLVTAGAAHRFGFLDTMGFFRVLALVPALTLLAVLLALYAFSRLWKYGDRGGRNLTIGLLISLVVLAPYAVAGYRAVAFPMLSDISTDPSNPPALVVAGRLRGQDMNPIDPPGPEMQRLQLAGYPDLSGRRYDLPAERVLDAVNIVLARRGWQITGPGRVSPDYWERTVEAFAYTTVFALPVDVAIRLRDDGDSTGVDMRSAFRYGTHDLGENAARITAFLADLDIEIAAQPTAPPPQPPPLPPDQPVADEPLPAPPDGDAPPVPPEGVPAEEAPGAVVEEGPAEAGTGLPMFDPLDTEAQQPQ